MTASIVGDEVRTASVGDTITLQVDAYCNSGTLRYRWYVYDYKSDEGYEWIEDANDSEYTIEVSGQADYECIVTDNYHNQKTLYFYIRLDNELTVQTVEASNALYREADEITYHVNASCKNGELSYQWYWGNHYYTLLEDETESSISFEAKVGEYTLGCFVRDEYGNEKSIKYNFTVLGDHPIILEEETDVVFEQYGKKEIFSYVPETTGQYIFTSNASTAVLDRGFLKACIYDQDGNKLIENDDEENYNNFRLIINLQAGEQYYLCVGYENDCKLTYPVKLEFENRTLKTAVLYLLVGHSVEIPDPEEYGSFENLSSADDFYASVDGNCIIANHVGKVLVTAKFENVKIEYQVYIRHEDVLRIPDEVQVIGEEAFYGDYEVGYIELGDEVQRIEDGAFSESYFVQFSISSMNAVFDGRVFGYGKPTVLCKAGSTAEEYAIRHGYTYVYF